MDTNAKFLGLDVKSPIIAGSCGLTASVENLVQLEKYGAGAIVLKSVFEEEIMYDIKRHTHNLAQVDLYGDSYEYIANHVADDSLERHFDRIRQAKKQLTIPIVGSINCFTHENWITYAKFFQEAGCDAIELNMSILPSETSLGVDDVDRTYSNVIQTLKRVVQMPISVKVTPYFTDMAKFMQQLSWMGVQGISMFNKMPMVDINVDKIELCEASKVSAPEELYNTLRWTAILSSKLRCPISATTGVYSADDVVKLLLAGAGTVQVVSALYKNGLQYMQDLNDGLKAWMSKHNYDKLDQFVGKLAVKSNDNASIALRTQFMRYFAEI